MSGDCTFEVDECGWSNVGTRERVDDIDWDRVSGQATRTSTHDHTLGSEKGKLLVQRRVNTFNTFIPHAFTILDVLLYTVQEGI
jgi:hypothetical protein